MSEKRFKKGDNLSCVDTETGKSYWYACNLCGLLNKQQATISKQLDQIIGLQDKYSILEFNHSRLEKRNKAQYEKIGEQQATIQSLKEENGQLKHWNKCLAEKRHNEKESNESLIKKLINKIDFLERIIDGDI